MINKFSDFSLEAVFFDLDGTLFDTAPDLNNACNQVLQKFQYPTIPLVEFRRYISGGTNYMITKSFELDQEDAQFQKFKQEFLANYQQQLTKETQLFPEINTLLDFLDDQNIPWGVVTGKPAFLAKPILEHFKLAERTRCLVAGDTISPGKPHPAPLLHACYLLGCQSKNCIYIGDADTDVIAASAAFMRSIAVSYGYADLDSHPEDWKADFVAATPKELFYIISDLV